MRRLPVAALFIFISSLAHSQAPTINRPEVAAILEPLLAGKLPIVAQGIVSVWASMANEWKRDGDINRQNTKIDMGEKFFSRIVALQKVGLLVIIEDTTFAKSKDQYDPKLFLEKSRGLVNRVHLRVTESGKQLLNDDGWIITISTGRAKVSEILKTEYRQVAIDTYAIIFFKYQVDWTPMYVAFVKEADNITLQKDRKGIVLLRYDLFSNSWKLVPRGIDTANQSEEFRTNNVQMTLSGLSGGR